MFDFSEIFLLMIYDLIARKVSAASTLGVLSIVAAMVSPLFLRVHICEFRVLLSQVYALERVLLSGQN